MLLLGSNSTSRTEFHGFHSVTVSDTTTMVLGYFQPAPMLYTHICKHFLFKNNNRNKRNQHK